MSADAPENWPVVFQGEPMRAAEAMIPATDTAVIRGDGAFDAFPVYKGRPFARAAHLDRLERSCAALDLRCPRAELEADLDLLLEQAGSGDAAVRVVLTRGGRRLCILEPLGDPDAISRPAALLPVSYEPSVVLNGVKSLSYAANMAASRRAVAAGYDEALLVKPDGTVLEGPTCTIFWVSGGQLRTPALDTGILASITRRVLTESMEVEEGAFPLADLERADEAFLASTARWAQPVARVGEHELASVPGERTRLAQRAIEAAMESNSIA
jgi:branched-chain amino acid aminotransferase